MRVGSLFAGYGGLDLGLEQALGTAEPAWFSEIDAAPSRILAHHWPDVPNLGDITAIDWAAVEPVDVLTGGFPCQDVSLAGLRRGLRPDTRSGLWAHFAAAIDALRPPLVIIENVRGLLSAEAHSDLEPDPWDLGDGNVRPPLRALGAVLGDLADLGYDAQWRGVRAADAGAPHGRFRVFIVANPAETDGRGYGFPEDPRRLGRVDGRDAGTTRERQRARSVPSDRSDTTPEDADIAARDQRRVAAPRQAPGGRPRADARRRGRASAGDAALEAGPRATGSVAGQAAEPRKSDRPAHRQDIAWGNYEPAIRRWEDITGRRAPAPTDTGKGDSDRLSARFVEWMMGLPADHVTDPVIGLTRSEQLKALGNGVVPQQAALALRHLLAPEATR